VRPPEWEGPDSPGGTGTDSKNQATTCATDFSNSSRQVSWWTVHEFVQPYLDAAGSWPMAGTPAWCLLDDDDPAKWAALLDGAQHHALRVELNQSARAEASRAVSATANWSAIATRSIQGRGDAYIKKAS
jgi:Protein of unknown function (DUF2742)